jgi:hypothetical protein
LICPVTTIQAARRYRADGEIRAAEAETEADAARKAQRHREAAESRALADVLDRQAEKLAAADDARAEWYAHTAGTRAAEQRARVELAARGVDPDAAEDTTTAEQRLADQRHGIATDDRHRQITDEHDLAHVVEQQDTDLRAVQPEPHRDAAETNLPDIRDEAAREPKRADRSEDDWTRVPPADEAAGHLVRAQRAIGEIQQRQREDQRRADEQARSRQLATWHRDHTAQQAARQRDDDHARDRS